jgi:DNA-binding MarR family transcriptional regulator
MQPVTSKNSNRMRQQIYNDMLISLRKIIQAISLHSRDLHRRYGLTGPQLMILYEISNQSRISVTELAKIISLSQATVTDILNRLEKKGLVTRTRSKTDKRRIMITTTTACNHILEMAPPSLQETFITQFSNLDEWEQMMIVSAFKRVVDLMSAGKIEAAPILDTDLLEPNETH